MLNTYSFVQDTGNGFGGIIRDAMGNVTLASVGSSAKPSILYQELLAIAKGMQYAKEIGITELEEELSKCWSTPTQGNLSNMLSKKLKLLKASLKGWPRLNTTDIQNLVDTAKARLEDIQKQIHMKPLDIHLCNLERKRDWSYALLCSWKNMISCKELTLIGSHLGTNAIAFFHKFVKEKKSRNNISSIIDSQGVMQEGQDKIYFQKNLTYVKESASLRILAARLGLYLNLKELVAHWIKWEPVADDSYMLNTNSLVQQNGNGFGGIIRDALGNVTLAYSGTSSKPRLYIKNSLQ
ncbi:hypothetical protein IFM89_030135 [Coptis chinensis]|uniref:RNase H type-1 domain-containing protein n=1 Tax=Coptis chinensis TaxID=261450 RepID=A0A835I610_9MAGN|nr:hypothetical protein IFM89_030135 [Coptis chinensis]